MDKLNWLDIVLDYGKRCPNVTIKDLGLKTFCGNYNKISEMVLDMWMEGFPEITTVDGFSVFVTSSEYNKGVLQYYSEDACWILVPQHILLRFLTEGKEDLI